MSRKVPPLPEFTFPTSGITVRTHRLGPWTQEDIRKSVRKKFPPPTPPSGKTLVGDDLEIEETNFADPDYRTRYQAWQTASSMRAATKLMEIIVEDCIVYDAADIDPEHIAFERRIAQRAASDDPIRQKEILEMTDREIFVRYVCLKSDQDLMALQEHVLGISQPTPEAVQAHIETFPSDVQGEVVVAHPSA